MEQLILVFHIIFAVFLVVLVLVQKGKGASMGASFGSGASQTVFGSKGSGGFLIKLTIGIAILFFSTSIALTYIASRQTKPGNDDSFLNNIEQISKIRNKIQQKKITKVAPKKIANIKPQKSSVHSVKKHLKLRKGSISN